MHDPSLSPPYTRYARVYDYSGQVRFALLMHLYLQDLFLRHPVNGRRAIDLACGTGTLALLLAADGWEVTGLDCSAAMLTEANAKNQAMSGKVRFVLGDMRRLDGLAPKEAFDLATCTYDRLHALRRRSGRLFRRGCRHSLSQRAVCGRYEHALLSGA